MRARALASLLVGLLTLATAACSSDDQPDATPSSESDVPAEVPTSAGATATKESETAAAAGEQVELENTVRFRVPEQYDWLVDDSGDEILATAVVDGGLVDVAAGDILNDGDSVDQVAGIVLDTLDDDRSATYRRVDDREVAGVDGFVIEAVGKEFQLLHFGTLHNGRLVRVSLRYPPSFATETAQEMFDAVLASVEWK